MRQLGYAVLEAMSPADAEGFARVHKGTIHLLVADLATPRVRGREFCALDADHPARIEIALHFVSGLRIAG